MMKNLLGNNNDRSQEKRHYAIERERGDEGINCQ